MVGGSVNANFHLAVYDDENVELMRSNPHTICLMPDADLDATVSAVNADITKRDGMKWPEISAEDWARVTAHCEIEHTPEVKAAYEKFKSAKDEISKGV